MRLDEMKGNDAVRAALAGMVDSGRVPHAIMFNEDDGGGAFPICIAFLEYLFCGSGGDSKISKYIHPDIHFIFPIQSHDKDTSLTHIAAFRALASENPYFKERELNDAIGAEGKQTGINVNEANYICEKLAFNSLEGGYKAILIYLPEKMNASAANKLLKSLEEPSGKTVFLLISHSPEKVLRTIDSRCLHMRVSPEALPEAADNPGDAEFRELFLYLMDAVAERRLLVALEVGEKISSLESRDRMTAFCRYVSARMRDIFLVQQGMTLPEISPEVASYAAKVKKNFPRNVLGVLDRAILLIERNVNPKILFTDMVDRMMTL